jgi:cytochrome c
VLVKQLLWLAALVLVLGWSSTETSAAEPGNIAVGQRLARHWCSDCHQVDVQRRHVKRPSAAPSFLEIANEPSTTPLSLRVFFRSNHKNMPSFHISRTQADDLVAYILSLKRR